MSAEFEAQILAEIRRTHAQLKKTPPSSTPAQGNGVHGWSMRLTIEEVDLLLAIVDERDDLKRRLLTDWEPDIVPKAETTDEASARVSERLAPKRPFPKPTDLRPHLDALHDAARTLAGVSAGAATTAPPAGCPFRDVIHDCPLGGCPDASPREVSIPDLPTIGETVAEMPSGVPLPKQGRAEKVTRELIEDVGREERETPPLTVMHIADPLRGGPLCGAERVTHITNGPRYADCPACLDLYQAPSA